MTGTTIIGVTGGIATGKTHVTDTLQRAGALVLDADVISRRLTGEGGEALPRVREAFGDSVFRPDGTLDRRALGARVFSSPEERKALEGILHPMILSEMRSRTREAEGLVFWSVPLLYECGMADECLAQCLVQCHIQHLQFLCLCDDGCAEGVVGDHDDIAVFYPFCLFVFIFG